MYIGSAKSQHILSDEICSLVSNNRCKYSNSLRSLRIIEVLALALLIYYRHIISFRIKGG